MNSLVASERFHWLCPIGRIALDATAGVHIYAMQIHGVEIRVVGRCIRGV
jgi:hypothetical protein